MTGDPHVDARLAAWKSRDGEPKADRFHENELEAGRKAGRRRGVRLVDRLRSMLSRR